jgi:hypothetical protein
MNVFQKIRKTIFGYDLFISYSRTDGLDYAYAIAQYLLSHGYECYIDQLSSISPGAELPPNIRDAVKCSTALVLIGSEGTQASDPVAKEVALFLENNRNNPLIPVTIGDAAFGAVWYKQVQGLALIDDTKANLIAASPAADVTNRLENALGFTKKSVRLRRIALTTVLLILATVAGAAYYTLGAAKAAQTARREKAKADSSREVAIIEMKAAQIAKDTALRQSWQAALQVKRASARLVQLDSSLRKVNQQILLVNKKSAVQNLAYNARIEHDLGNSSAAFRYARMALEKERSIPGGGSAIVLTASLLNDFTPKYLDNFALPFQFDNYGSDRKPYISRMQIFPMRRDKLQLIDFTREPRIKEGTRMRDDNQGYCPTLILTYHELAAMDIKHNRNIPLNRKNGKYIPLAHYGYYFGADPAGHGYEALSNLDSNDRVARNLRIVRMDADLDTLSDLEVDSAIATYLHRIASRDRAGDYYYLCPGMRDQGKFALSVLHPADTSTLIVIPLDGKSPAPQNYTLSHLQFHHRNSESPSYSCLKYLRLTDTSILYMAKDSLYAHDRRTGQEKLVMAFCDLPEECNNYHSKYHYALDQSTGMIFAADSGYRVTILKQGDNGWQIFSRCRLSDRLDSLTYDKNEQMIGIHMHNRTVFDHLDHYLSEAAGHAAAGTPYWPGHEIYYTSARHNFHFENNGSLQLVDNNDNETRSALATVKPNMYFYSNLSHTILSVDTRNDIGKVSVSDISNAMLLPDSIRDDVEFSVSKFEKIPDEIQFDTTLVKGRDAEMSVSMFKLLIYRNGNPKLYQPDDAVMTAGFTNRLGWIFFFTSADAMSSSVTFNLYNYSDDFRYALPLKLFKMPDEFQFTRKYIYFSQSSFTDKKQRRKIIRIVNPAIDRHDLERILAKSIY